MPEPETTLSARTLRMQRGDYADYLYQRAADLRREMLRLDTEARHCVAKADRLKEKANA